MTRAGFVVRTAFAVLVAIFAATAQNPARASDEVLAALAARGFVPWGTELAAEMAFSTAPSGDEVLLGSGFLVRLPQPSRARQFLVSHGTQSVIVDRLEETGPFALSRRAVRALRLDDRSDRSAVKLQIIALLRGRRPQPGAAETAVSPGPGVATSTPGRQAAIEPEAPRETFTWDRQAEANPDFGDRRTGRYALQAGFFGVQGNAEKLVARLRQMGLPATSIAKSTKNGPRWRVLVGPFASITDRDAAKAAAGGLLAEAFPVAIPP